MGIAQVIQDNGDRQLEWRLNINFGSISLYKEIPLQMDECLSPLGQLWTAKMYKNKCLATKNRCITMNLLFN